VIEVAGRRSQVAGLVLLLFAGCRTGGPSANETPFEFGQTPARSVRALVRVRASRGEQTQSFRAQLLIDPRTDTVELNGYTPIGTSAMTLFAAGDQVVVLNHVDRTAWEGSAASLDFFGGATPSAWALAAITEPSTTITRGDGRVEITRLEAYNTDAVPRKPVIPRDYQCCVAPKL
jgi:hypothetical protein